MAAAPSAPRLYSISLNRGSSGRRGLTTGEDKELRDRQQGHVREETSEKGGKNRAVGHEEKEEDLEWEDKPVELSVVVGQKPEGTLWSYFDRASLRAVHPSLSERRGHVCIYSQIGRTTWSKYFILIYVQAALELKKSRTTQKCPQKNCFCSFPKWEGESVPIRAHFTAEINIFTAWYNKVCCRASSKGFKF